MAESLRRDIYTRSSATLGAKLITDTRIVDEIAIEGLPGTSNKGDLAAAEAHVLNPSNVPDANSEFSPPAPLRLSRLRHLTPGVVRGELVFQRIPGVTVPTLPAHVLARSYHGQINLRYYRAPTAFDSNGRPTGPIMGFSTPGGDPTARVHMIPLTYTRYIIPTVLATDPRPGLKPYIDMVNTTPVTLRGITTHAGSDTGLETFGDAELRIRDAHVTPIEIKGGVVYSVQYVVDALPAPGWVEQVFINLTSGAPTAIGRIKAATLTGLVALADFVFPSKYGNITGALPVHTPVP